MVLSCKTSITLLLAAAFNIVHASEGLVYVKFVLKYATMYTNITGLTLQEAHSTKIQCGGACVQHGGCDGFIFDKISKECVFCSVLAVVPYQNDTQLSIKIYVKEDLVEFLETESHIKGSTKILIAGSSLRDPNSNDVTQVFDLTDAIKICQPLDKLEFDNHIGAAYGLLNNAYPIFCGGKSGTPKLMNTFPDKVGDPCYKPCSNRAGACPWCGTEGLCCKQNEAINECDGTHVRPHISFKETYPQWNDCETIPNTGGAGQRSAHRCILPPEKQNISLTQDPLGHCWILQHPNKTKIPMDQEREYAGGVLLDPETLWVAGGKDFNGSLLKSTIFVTIDGFTEGPDLPYANADFCFLNNRGSNFVMIGGLHDNSSFQMYDFISNAWTEGPNLPVPFGHGITCTLNFYHGDFSIIVVGGTSEEKLAESDEIVAIQIYSLSKKEWLQSDPKHWKSNYINAMTGGTVLGSWLGLEQKKGKLYHIGGDGPGGGSYEPERIITYTCYSDDCPGVTPGDSWKRLQRPSADVFQFSTKRANSYVMFIPENMANCTDP